MECGEEWYETPKGQERMRSIGDNETLTEDASENDDTRREPMDSMHLSYKKMQKNTPMKREG